MKYLSLFVVLPFALSGCSGVMERVGLRPKPVAVEAPVIPLEPAVNETVLAPATAAPPPPAGAKTAEALDTTTAAQRAAATAPPKTPTQDLGTTVVSLGSVTEPGLWLKTPLVQAETQGRVTNRANGKSSLVTLIPIEGPKTSGSRMSLAALRLIEASLTDLTEVSVALAN